MKRILFVLVATMQLFSCKKDDSKKLTISSSNDGTYINQRIGYFVVKTANDTPWVWFLNDPNLAVTEPRSRFIQDGGIMTWLGDDLTLATRRAWVTFKGDTAFTAGTYDCATKTHEEGFMSDYFVKVK